MNTFFKVFFGCLLAIAVAAILFIVVISGVVGSLTQTEKPVVKEKTVLFLDLTEKVAEQGKGEDLNPFTLEFEATPGIHDYIYAIYHAVGDSMVKALYLHCRGNNLGLASTQELGEAIDSFRSSGKPVVTFTDMMPQRAYELAHRGSHVFMQPGCGFEWSGLFVEVMFFKNLLDKIELKPEVFYAGQFKSATEPFRFTKMSEPNRIQYKAYIDEVYKNMVNSVSKHRGVDTATLRLFADRLEVRTSEDALAKGLIDGTLYDDQVRDTLRKLIGKKDDDEIPFMKLDAYFEAISKVGTGDKIAVVYADGAIVDGKGEDDEEVASDPMRRELAKMREDDKVKAVVFRVNSPGGSAIASEVIWREIHELRKKKPVVVSMGNYAASGGYYISCDADSIFAEPNTLTGSIGVFSILFDAQKLFNDKLGINFDGVSTNTYSDYGSVARPMTAFEKQVAQKDVDGIYVTFKKRVVDGRKLQGSFVDSIAQGRVWSGRDALQIGLIDRIGGLRDAIACAARMAKLDKYNIRSYPVKKTLFQKILGNDDDEEETSSGNTNLLEKQLEPTHAKWLKEYRSLRKLANTPQARLPFVLQLP